MKNNNSIKSATMCLLLTVSALAFIAIFAVNAHAEPSFSVSYDFLPYQDFKDPIIDTITGTDTTYFADPNVKLEKFRASMSFPISVSEGRTTLINEFTYQLIEFRFRAGKTLIPDEPDKLHSFSYTLMLQHQLSKKWSLWALGTPSLASDLDADVSKEDFNFQVAAIFVRKYSEKLSLGFGAAYSTQFGSAVPLPVLAFDWNNGKNLMVKGILPASLEFWYSPGSRVDLGLLVAGDGNNFRGDPAIYGVADPELRYTMMTIGPAAKITVAKNVTLNIETGIIGLHRFEFFDGDDERISYDLKPSQFARVSFTYGE
jgi:hypothetical protein